MRPDDIARIIASEFGANASYVEDLFRRFQHNPRSVDEEWGEYFASLTGGNGSAETVASAAAAKAPAPSPAPAPQASNAVPAAPASAAAEASEADRRVIRGPALRIVENMEASLAVPIATSVRQIPIKLLDENRRWVNRHLQAHNRGKTSYTHFIAWAIVKSLAKFPQMNDGFEEEGGAAYRVRRSEVNLGVAVDVMKKDGTRTLLVPNVKGANRMTFPQFLDAYQDVVLRARDGKLQVSDFQGTTISLTNPGTIGTSASNPRLMAGQGAIIATGAIEYPPEYAAMTPAALSLLGISKVFTITSTYDHRIIQGAESGAFLAHIHQLLLGEHRFYDEIFAELGITYKPLRWSVDVNPALFGVDRERQEIKKQARIFELINAYRVRGHLIADTDPLNMIPLHEHPELDIETYGLSIWDLDREFFTSGLGGRETATLREIWAMLIRFYCGTIGLEYRHIQSLEQKQWLREQIERDPEPIPVEIKKQLLNRLIAAEQFERFLHTKFLGQKRFSVEGGESIIPLLDQLIVGAGERGLEEIIMGMAHRGRLTVLANIIGNFSERIFTAFEGTVHPNFPADEGDVKYHQGATGVREVGDREVKLTLSPNPSHLEFVDAVVEGMARARQDQLLVEGDKETARKRIMPVLIHGDAAFAGQGIVAEVLNFADLKGYRTGGTIHIIINNQIGFTTTPERGRSSIYSTDVAKMTQLPIFHVNGDDVEAAYRVLQIAMDFRHKFHKDVVIDLIGFRRHGHNEGDEPSYTQPLMYQRVKEHPGVRELYTRQLLREQAVTPEEVEKMLDERWRRLENGMLAAKEIVARQKEIKRLPARAEEDDGSELYPTPIAKETIAEISNALGIVPQGFNLNPKMVGQIGRRTKMGAGEAPVDWGFAEGLAFGSLLIEGISVRLSGQDSGRGTFSQRHAVLYDTHTGQPWAPLESLARDDVRFDVFDSSLSEAGVLGFEHGYAVVSEDTLVLWEAQFGDFANGAQVIIDQFISSAEDKWQQKSRLVLLLPHGYEGQGPEHSSARLERFLQLCAENNLQVCYPSTPVQYFHLLRRQMKQNTSRPLVVMTPKSLLRLPAATSGIDEFSIGGFQPVIPDAVGNPGPIERLVLCSGKIYYDLKAEAAKAGSDRIAVLRVEQFYPFPQRAIREWIESFPNAEDVVWLQEEPMNMGAWTFMRPRLEAILSDRQALRYIGRGLSASPATGSYAIHQLEQQQFLREVFG
ncbi:MAG: multifunctional oxoglutarate decarboxylase/oxoglutarate dehydrogenase thiamine pyrophosphate-binding subunit/dihydrolipoyllysine-residue succinyltransferase subunit [Acidobacteria bacterium]|nr:multifunctional oxoglutarate decarboxylase/oxoglutarate dehydrogenase thiamine pyrophosphate-binding subunit/dihydrolipoyllysine-residue succinyltransferase subunit [Acidobacteriota bacterium]